MTKGHRNCWLFIHWRALFFSKKGLWLGDLECSNWLLKSFKHLKSFNSFNRIISFWFINLFELKHTVYLKDFARWKLKYRNQSYIQYHSYQVLFCMKWNQNILSLSAGFLPFMMGKSKWRKTKSLINLTTSHSFGVCFCRRRLGRSST